MLRCSLFAAVSLLLSTQVPLLAQAPTATYLVEVTVTRSATGVSPQVAHYTLDVQAGPRGDALTLSERVPVSTGNGNAQYQPVGTSLRCHVQPDSGGVELNLHASVDRFSQATPDASLPRLASVVLDADTVVPLGKEVTLATASGADARYTLAARVTATGR